VRAKAPSSEKQTYLSFPDYETEGVRSLYEEMRNKVVGMHLVAAGVSIAAAFLVAFSHVGPASARYSKSLFPWSSRRLPNHNLLEKELQTPWAHLLVPGGLRVFTMLQFSNIFFLTHILLHLT